MKAVTSGYGLDASDPQSIIERVEALLVHDKYIFPPSNNVSGPCQWRLQAYGDDDRQGR